MSDTPETPERRSPEYKPGDMVLIRKRRTAHAGWERALVVAVSLEGPGGRPWRHGQHDVATARRTYTLVDPGSDVTPYDDGKPYTEHDYEFIPAQPNPWRDRWHGDVALETLADLQLYCHDFGLDQAATALPVALDGGELTSAEGEDYDGRARVVITPRPGLRVTVDLWRLFALAVHTGDHAPT